MTATVLRGRIQAASRQQGERFLVELVGGDGDRRVLARTRANEDGTFRVTREGELGDGLALRVRPAPGGAVLTETALGAGDLDSQLIVSLPEAPLDPRETVAAVAEAIEAEKEAAASAREILGRRLEETRADDERVRRVVRAVVADLAPTSGADVRFRVDENGDRRAGDGGSAPGRFRGLSRGRGGAGGRPRGEPSDPAVVSPVAELTSAALAEGAARLAANPRSVRARKGKLADGEEVSSNELVKRLTGRSPTAEGYRRLSARERRQRELEAKGPDGLPQPAAVTASRGGGAGDRGGSDGDGSPDSTIATVRERAVELVEAIRLPEDPPLLVADGPVGGDGASFELARGIADVTAFHDVHELVLALPDVWQEVFDKRLTEVVEATVRHLIATGVDVDAVVDNVGGRPRPGRRLAALVEAARANEALFATTMAARIRPPLRPLRASSSSAIAGLVRGDGAIVARIREDGGDGGAGGSDRPPPRPPVPHPPFDNGGTFPDDPQVKVDPSRVPAQDLLDELESFLTGQHSFTVFAAEGSERAMNFGVLVTWRQTWDPLSWQTGEIANTMTLAPGEERKVVTRHRQSLKRYTAAAQKAQRGRSTDTTDTTRAETEILRKADASTNFQLTSAGSTKLLVADGSFTTSGTRNVSKDSSDTRRRFREAVVKAAQEYREENSMEVRTETEDSFEEETTATLRNNNDEIAMTAVYFQLQRRYLVSEHLYRLRPVILVAMPVPNPAEITTGWIVRYDWLLRRSLLDADFDRAIVYLSTSYLGDREVLEHLEQSMEEHRQTVEATRSMVGSARALAEQRAAALTKLQRDLAEGREPDFPSSIPGLDLVVDAISFGNLVGDILGGGDDDAQRREREEMLVQAAEDELARAERRAQEAETELAAATSAYQEAVRAFVEAKRDARNQEVQIARLRVHILDNLLYYLQAIWSSQPPDQRFLELHAIQVPVLNGSVQLASQGTVGDGGLGGFTPEQFEANFVDTNSQLELRPLAEVADLDQLLGFKGNYAIFPLREGNAITDFISAPYLDEHEILSDPDDPAANWTISELRDYADQLRADLAAGLITQQEFDQEYAPFLRRKLEELLTDPTPSEEIVVVPSNSLYVDLLTSGGTLLEPFKLEHRGIDVAKVRAETREAELENLRFAARLLTDELDDPRIDKRILVEGSGVLVSPGDA